MIIDMHGHLGNINQAPFWAAGADDLDRACAQAGVDTLCVSSARSLMYDASQGNAELDAALRTSQRLLGYVTVNPMFPDTMKDLALLDRNPKFRGVKAHPDYHGYDMASRRALAFLDQVADQVPLMLFHVSCMAGTGFAAPLRVARFAARHPRTSFVLAHVAGIFQNPLYPYFPNLQGLEDVVAMNLPNVFIDTAHYLTYVYPGVMEHIVEIASPDRLVFGSDAPLQGPMQMRFAIQTIQALDIPAPDKEKILSRNAAALLRLP